MVLIRYPSDKLEISLQDARRIAHIPEYCPRHPYVEFRRGAGGLLQAAFQSVFHVKARNRSQPWSGRTCAFPPSLWSVRAGYAGLGSHSRRGLGCDATSMPSIMPLRHFTSSLASSGRANRIPAQHVETQLRLLLPRMQRHTCSRGQCAYRR